MTYFEFYDIPVSFHIHTTELKRLFLQKSRQYHPDFYTQADAETQEQALNWSTFNNKAYQTLSDIDLRIQYILTIKGLMSEGERYELPHTFLMQMMDINELIMELEFDTSQEKIINITQELQFIDDSIKNSVNMMLQNYSDKPEEAENLKKIKEFYYKRRYLLRIRESLRKFAP